jgi:thymidylate synthase
MIGEKNVHMMLPEALHLLEVHGVERESRNGPVVMFPMPATLCYTHPRERVIRWKERDANPFLHFFECLWMLNGQNDVKFVSQFSSNIENYSDNGKTFNAAYGHRWRRHFGVDQIHEAIQQLTADKDTRRVYISMWDTADLVKETKDKACNTGMTLQVNHKGELDMVVHNRSNDLIWGATGANAVHMSFLQEFVASAIGVPVGRYWQVSSNLHAYKSTLEKVKDLADMASHPTRSVSCDYYVGEKIEPYPICSVPAGIWLQDLAIFMKEGPIVGFRDAFFRQVATPMLRAHQAYKNTQDPERYETAEEILEQCRAADWRLAAIEWVRRRKINHLRARADGPVEY